MKSTELDMGANVFVYEEGMVPLHDEEVIEVAIEGYSFELHGSFPKKGMAFVTPEDATLAQIKVLLYEGEPTIRALYQAPTNQLVIRTPGEYRIRPTNTDDMPPGTEIWGRDSGVIRHD